MRKVLCLAAGLWLLTGAALVAQAENEARLGRTVDDFVLADFRGQEHRLGDLADKKLVVLAFLGTECPLAKLYAPRLAQLAAEYEPQGVAFLGICSNQQDAVTEIGAYARLHGVNFPLLKDLSNRLADAVQAERTPEVYVLDAQRVVRYHGRIDDQYGFQDDRVGYQLAQPRRRDLALALNELLAGQAVSQPQTVVSGCRIGRVRTPDPTSEVTFSNQIARIFNNRCVTCHREGQIGPFALTSYSEAAGWAEMIREVVEEQRMPPWHADPAYGDFVNDARLTEEEQQLIYRWVDAGAPEGNPTELPEPPQFTQGWMIPEPDQVIYMADEPFTVPAEGTVPYQRFIVDPGWGEDRWIKAIEPVPGNPAIVHHIVMYIVPPEGPRKGQAARLRTDWLAAFAPGLRPQVLPEGYARLIPKGYKLVFELHYTPNGTEQQDRSYLGVVFADPKAVKRELAVKNAGNFSFRIPAGEPNFEVHSEFEFREDSLLWSVSPHMHVRGKDFFYELKYPDGRVEPVLWVPRYDFAWQTTYVFREPKRLPKGTVMHCVAHFDNSEDNLNNPNPNETVRWGEQTYEEMMFGWFEMALADQDLTQPQPPPVDRVQKFRDLAQASGTLLSNQLREIAFQALTTEDNFEFFTYYLSDTVPQLDRVCVTYVEAGKLRVKKVEELNDLKTTLRSTSTVVKADGELLASYVGSSTVVNHANLSEFKGGVFEKMFRKGMQSSLHIPVVVDGVPMCFNFWSTDAGAFPDEAVSLLDEVARLAAQPPASAEQK